MLKRYNWLIATALGSALILPFLGSYGLWDPIEIREADVAQEVARQGSYLDVTVDGQYSPRPVLYVWLVALGFKLLGVNELAGRLPLALCGILTLLLAFRVGSRLISERAGLISALVLTTVPIFLFQSRQLASETPYYLMLLAAVGGLAAYLWPADEQRKPFDLVIAAIGLIGGFLARGLILGTAFPLAGFALAVALSWRTPRQAAQTNTIEPSDNKNSDDTDSGPAADEPSAGEPAEGPSSPAVSSPAVSTVGQELLTTLKPMLIAVGGAALAIGLLLALLKSNPYLLLGGEYRRIEIPPTFETLFKEIGFGFFPWFALLPLAFGRFVLAQQRSSELRDPSAFPKVLVLVLICGAYILGVIWMGYLGDLRFPALPWLGLAVGILVAELWVDSTPIHRLWGIVALALILVIQQDYWMDPQSLAFSHLTTTAKYPAVLSIKSEARIFGLLFAMAFFLSLGGLPRPIRREFSATTWGRLAYALSVIPDQAGRLLRTLAGNHGRNVWYISGVAALVFAGWCSFYLLPQLSLHLSNKTLFQTYHRCRQDGEQLAQYQVSGRGAAYYNDGQIKDLRTQADLFTLLRQPQRWFVLVPASSMAALDQAARRSKVDYFVLDDRNSQFLILSNKLAGRCTQDKNPLRRFVLKERPKIRKPLVANFENRVKLLGYDVDDVVTVGGSFKITLYFQVLGPVPPSYKIFIHFDQPANRFHGDHEPLGSKYPTQFWLPGDYIVDEFDVEIPAITTPGGRYTIYMGFWRGEERLKITEGPNDGANRVTLGSLRVRTLPF